MTPERWLQVAGIGTWMATVLPALAGVADGRMRGWPLGAWAAASLGFLVAFCVFCWSPAARRRRAVAAALLFAQAVSSLAMVSLTRDGLASGILLVVVAGQLQWVTGTRLGAIWVACQTAALVAIFSRFMSPVSAVTFGGAYGGFQLFALGTSALAFRERRAREALAVANAELHATRSLLTEHARVAERLRIARDLHDALGHHLTALSLQLDVASRLTTGAAAEHVAEAHGLARLLLADVRDVVGQLRESGRVELVQAVRRIAQSAHDPTGSLAIHVDADREIALEDEAQAHALLRCVQEIVTNAMRHAHARHLWLRLESGADGVRVHARDDGRGTTEVTWGHGLTGMRERFEALNGRLEISSSAEGGFEVRGFMPRAQVAS